MMPTFSSMVYLSVRHFPFSWTSSVQPPVLWPSKLPHGDQSIRASRTRFERAILAWLWEAQGAGGGGKQQCALPVDPPFSDFIISVTCLCGWTNMCVSVLPL